MFSLICAWLHAQVNNREAADFRRHLAHYDVIVMILHFLAQVTKINFVGHKDSFHLPYTVSSFVADDLWHILLRKLTQV